MRKRSVQIEPKIAQFRLKDSVVKKPYRIVIAEDHTILREGLRSLLSSNPDFDVAGEAEDGRDAVRSIWKFKPDLVVLNHAFTKKLRKFLIKKSKSLSKEPLAEIYETTLRVLYIA